MTVTSPLLILEAEDFPSTDAFVARMAQIVRHSRWARIDQNKLFELAGVLEKPTMTDSFDVLTEAGKAANPFTIEGRIRIAQEMAFVVANMSGFAEIGPDGVMRKWQGEASGPVSFVTVLHRIWDSGAIAIDGMAVDRDGLRACLGDIPHADARVEMACELFRPEGRQAMHDLLPALPDAALSMREVVALSRAYPQGFGFDPMYKKAALWTLAMARTVRPRGVDMKLDVPCASDGRVPQSLQQAGVLALHPALNDMIEARIPLDEDHKGIQHMRAAAIVAVRQLEKLTGFDISDLDSALWMAGRAEIRPDAAEDTAMKRFQHEKRPQVLVPTLRF